MMEEKVTFVVGHFLEYIKSKMQNTRHYKQFIRVSTFKGSHGRKRESYSQRIISSRITKTRTIEPFLNW